MTNIFINLYNKEVLIALNSNYQKFLIIEIKGTTIVLGDQMTVKVNSIAGLTNNFYVDDCTVMNNNQDSLQCNIDGIFFLSETWFESESPNFEDSNFKV